MTKYIKQERARYWPVSKELMAQYNDGSHTNFNGLGTLAWAQNNQYHRDGDKPAWISGGGRLEWFQNGRWNRDGDKPAVIAADGTLYWYQNGRRHRICGPAVIYPSGKLEWVIYNKNITQEVNEWLTGEEWHGIPEQIFEFQLRFG